MKDLLGLLDEAARFRATGTAFALATLVGLDGPGYRRPGARMLVAADGETVGALSGGGLEPEVAARARAALAAGTPALVTLHVDGDDPVLGFGTGSEGIAHVLVEPVPLDGHLDPLALLEAVRHRRLPAVLATVTAAHGRLAGSFGRRLLRFEDGARELDVRLHGLEEDIDLTAVDVLADGRSAHHTHTFEDGDVDVFYEVVRPPLRLVLFGDGHGVGPVVRFARALDWHVTVVGGKPEADLARRFPDADAHAFLVHPAEALDQLSLDAQSAAVVMSHDHVHDRTLIGALLTTPAAYIGALGSRRRTDRMLDEFAAAGMRLTEAQGARLHAPAGLDIGTETPAEIALALVAEIQAALHRRPLRAPATAG